MPSSPDYQYFIGIDIAKSTFIVSCSSQKNSQKFLNTPVGFKDFYEAYQHIIQDSLVIMETTGNYELALIKYLLEQNVKVHQAHALQVKNFVLSLGKRTKTDKADSQSLVLYRQERHRSLQLYIPQNSTFEILKALVLRREDLIKLQTQEKNRLKAPGNSPVKKSIETILACLAQEIQAINKQIEDIFEAN
jgi:transposase